MVTNSDRGLGQDSFTAVLGTVLDQRVEEWIGSEETATSVDSSLFSFSCFRE